LTSPIQSERRICTRRTGSSRTASKFEKTAGWTRLQFRPTTWSLARKTTLRRRLQSTRFFGEQWLFLGSFAWFAQRPTAAAICSVQARARGVSHYFACGHAD